MYIYIYIDVSYPVRIGNLRKVYRNNIFMASKLDKIAVKSLCLTLEEGKLLALLGQNVRYLPFILEYILDPIHTDTVS
jgi:ABC-type antimicrobial peptide transport system ATPase subunit